MTASFIHRSVNIFASHFNAATELKTIPTLFLFIYPAHVCSKESKLHHRHLSRFVFRHRWFNLMCACFCLHTVPNTEPMCKPLKDLQRLHLMERWLNRGVDSNISANVKRIEIQPNRHGTLLVRNVLAMNLNVLNLDSYPTLSPWYRHLD